MAAVRVWVLGVTLTVVALGVLGGGGVAQAATAPTLGETWVTDVAGSSATLEAQIDPEGAETSYRFEYGTTEAYGSSVPVAGGGAGAGSALVTVEAHTQSLAADTAYHFRVVAVSAGGTVDGADHTFTTQPAGGELTLPDGREWELVSPAVKDGGTILPLELSGDAVQAAADGGAMTYLMTAPPEANPAGNTNETQMLSTRGPDGWSSRGIAPPHPEADAASVNAGAEYKVFSSDLAQGLVQPFVGVEGREALLSPQASEYTIYLHDDADGGGEGYLPLVWSGDVPLGTKFGLGIGRSDPYAGAKFAAASPDLSHIVLSSTAALTSTPIPIEKAQLYEWSEGHLRLVSVLPGGNVPCESGIEVGYDGLSARGAVSSDGSRVFWECEGHLYMHVSEGGFERSVQLDAVQGGTGRGLKPTEPRPIFQLASSDGSRVFFDDPQALTADASEGSPGAEEGYSLYECDIVETTSAPSCELSDLSISEHAGEAAGVSGVLGASEDGSYVYFLAGGVLAPGASPAHCNVFNSNGTSSETCNLYLRHDGVTKFITALSDEDQVSAGNEVGRMTARVSPNGRYLAFMSDRSLTGYDNLDANSGVADEEVFLYSAEANRLICASCNPTEARPVGVESRGALQLFDAQYNWYGRWVAGNIPSWTGTGNGEARYQSRYLSDSGRLFFNSSDMLVPQDTNGTVNVYEYEPAGVGSCTSSSAGFNEGSGGCVGLLSSGTSAEESVFLDASESGEDVFFLTASQLAPQDSDNAYDVYDAHECSAASPCPASVVAPPPCTTADSCRAAPSPQPAVFGAPPSATFNGVGNFTPPAVAVTGKTKKAKPKAKHARKGKKHKRKRKASRRSRAARRRG